MKTILKKTFLTLSLIAGTFAIAHANNNDLVLRTVEGNNLGQPEFVTISKTKENKITDHIKQYKLSYNQEGKTESKEISKWNKAQKEWQKSERYIYTYNQNGSMSYQIVQKWDKESQSWNNIGYMIYDAENSYLVEK